MDGASITQSDPAKARFNQPIGIAVDTGGNFYIADSMNYTIRKIAASGTVSTLAGTPGVNGSANGSGPAAQFSGLKSITVDSGGNVYVVDGNAIRKITQGGVVTTLAGAADTAGNADGTGTAAQFNQPWGIVADGAGNLYVGDAENYLIRKITPTGVVTTLAGSRGQRGNIDGSGARAAFLGPHGIAIDGAGNLYVMDWLGPPAPNIPERSTLVRKITPNGTVTTLAGNINSEFAPALFNDAFAVTADTAGNVYVAAQRTVSKVAPNGSVSTLVESSPQFQSLLGVMIDSAGNLFVSDTPSHCISKVTSGGVVTVFAGAPGQSGSSDVP